MSIEETRRLFAVEWQNDIARAVSLTAVATGLRLGELLGLDHAAVKAGYIEVTKTWDHVGRVVKQGTKTGRSRTVIIPRLVNAELIHLMNENPHPGGPERFVFYGELPTAPLDGKAVLNNFKLALYDIGITEQERRARNVVFHSFRHQFNSILINAKVPLLKVRQLTGHSSLEMAEHYYHTDDMADVREVQERLLFSLDAPEPEEVN